MQKFVLYTNTESRNGGVRARSRHSTLTANCGSTMSVAATLIATSS